MKDAYRLIVVLIIVCAATFLAAFAPNDELTAAIAGGLVVSLKDVVRRGP